MRAGAVPVRTEARASPSGLPFKVMGLEGTISDPRVVRDRVCDLGFLRHAVVSADGSLVWRCPAEPETDYVRKGGLLAETRGRLCICNGLLATIGLGQTRGPGRAEPPLVTCGDDLPGILRFARPGAASYSAREVLDGLVVRA